MARSKFQKLLDDIPINSFQLEFHAPCVPSLFLLITDLTIADHAAFPRREISCNDMPTCLFDEPEIERQIVDGGQLQSQHLARFDQVVQIGFAVSRVDRTNGHPGRWARSRSPHFLLRILMVPKRVKSCPLRPLRVGMIQSNISTPRSMASRMFIGVPTPIR